MKIVCSECSGSGVALLPAEQPNRAGKLLSDLAAEGLSVVPTETLRLLAEAAEVGAAHVEGCGDQGRAADQSWVVSVRAAIKSTRGGS